MKKKLMAVLSIGMIAVAVISGTYAYLTSEDSDVNVMTLGKAQIEQIEKERVDMTYESQENPAELKDWEKSPLYPAVLDKDGYAANDQQCWAPGGAPGALEEHYVNWGDFVDADVQEGNPSWNGIWGTSLKNVKDKFVFVENTGDVDVYYRTIILYEYDETETMNDFDQPMIHFNLNENDRFVWTYADDYEDITTVEVNGEVYGLMVATYQLPLLPGTTSRPSLLQVGLDGEATNEIVAQFGDTYDILVLSQAVQTAGFANAETALNAGFGEITTDNLKEWFGDVQVPTFAGDADKLENAVADGGLIKLEDDVTAENLIKVESDVEIDLQGNALDGSVENHGELDVYGGTISSDTYGIENFGDATYTDVTMNAGSTAHYAVISNTGSVTELNAADITSAGGGVGAANGAQVEFNGGIVAVNSASTSGRYNFYAEGEGTVITINDGEFSFSKTLNQKRAYIYAGAGTTVYVNGGTFGPASTRSGYTEGIMGDGTVIVKGGTFGFNPSKWVAEGYQAVKTGTVWVVSAI